MSPNRARHLSEEQLQEVLTQVDKTLDELDALSALEQRLTHKPHPHVLLGDAHRRLTGYRLSIASLQLRKQTIGR